MLDALLQKRDEHGEKTGELQTATENDIEISVDDICLFGDDRLCVF